MTEMQKPQITRDVERFTGAPCWRVSWVDSGGQRTASRRSTRGKAEELAKRVERALRAVAIR